MQVRLQQLSGVTSRALPIVALVLGTMFAASQLNHGWVPWDDGTLAQSAQRVLLGELPHRDFAELYTGGLSFLNAGVFWVAGGNLFWLRVPCSSSSSSYLPCVYLIARRFASPAVATLAALLRRRLGAARVSRRDAVLVHALPRGDRRILPRARTTRAAAVRWLFAAGVAGGLSIACKITGVWYVLAVAVYLVYRAQRRERCLGGTRDARRGVGDQARLRRRAGGLGPVRRCGARREARGGGGRQSPPARGGGLRPGGMARASWRRKPRVAVRAGGAVPRGSDRCLSSSSPFRTRHGVIGDLYTGLFVTPRGRLESGYYGTAGPVALVFAVPTLGVLYASDGGPRSARTTDLVASAVGGCAVARLDRDARRLPDDVVRDDALLPVGVLVGVGCCPRGRRRRPGSAGAALPPPRLTAFVGLVQFPFGAPVYFCFVAPLGVLAWLAMFRHTPLHASIAPHLPDAAARGDRRFRVRGQPQRPLPGRDPAERQLAERGPGSRSSLDPGQPDASGRRTSRRWRCFAPRTRRLRLAGPDTPEIYALTGLRNPTRSLFDYLDPRAPRGTRTCCARSAAAA